MLPPPTDYGGGSDPVTRPDRFASTWRIIVAMANPLRWSAIAENVSSPVAVASGERRVTVLCRGPAGELLLMVGERGEYQPPTSLGLPLARDGSTTVPVDWPIGACPTAPGEIQLVARGPEGELLHGTLKGTEWGGFESIGSPATSFG